MIKHYLNFAVSVEAMKIVLPALSLSLSHTNSLMQFLKWWMCAGFSITPMP